MKFIKPLPAKPVRLKPFIPGGDNENKTINSQMDQIARQEIAEIAGHSRLSIASAYIGGHS